MFEEENLKAEYFTLKNFKFKNGESLEEAKVEYMTLGTPQYDENGVISNAIVYFHGSSGNFSSIRRISEVCGSGKVFDTDKFFFISLSALGSPDSACPSSTGLKNKFPFYDVEDMVNFQKEFLFEKFGITHLKGLIGNSMGGFEVLTWAAIYPDSIDFAVSLVSSFKVGGHNYALSKIMNNILESDPDYNGGDYEVPISDSLKRSLKLSSDAMYCYGLSREEYRNNMTNDEIAEAMAEFAEESLEEDVNDLIYRNNSSLDYDLTDKLGDISAKVLIIAINQDQYFPPNLDAIPMSKMIKNNKLIIFDSLMGHVGSSELNKIESELEEFMVEFKN
ncbi:alpha/beta fold hydrolase [uncultured Methanobrevibacter sp.]|uniref:alpha/beta fold hydrolase n=1 Tax=uncultured Methanobrevibacter sp. TaxID=253161 RepID=UPI00262E37C5